MNYSGFRSKIFDEHLNRVSDLVEWLEELEVTDATEATPVVVADPSLVLIKRLRYIDQEKAAIIEAWRSPPPGPELGKSTSVAARKSERNHCFRITTGRYYERNTCTPWG